MMRNSRVPHRSSVPTRTAAPRRPGVGVSAAFFGTDDGDDVTHGTPLAPKVLQRLLRSARQDGRLNLSNKAIKGPIPDAVWHIYDPPETAHASIDTQDAWWEAVDLTRLIAADNEITTIDEQIGQFGGLEVVDIHNNKVQSLPSSMNGLTNITTLNLAQNLFASVPDCIAHMMRLKSLHLQGNQLKTIPPFVTQLPLTHLDLSSNQLTELPDMSRLEGLAKLLLSKNQLRALPRLPRTMRELEVAENQLVSLAGDDPIEYPFLERLDARQNRLVGELGPGLVAPNLKELYLSFNALTNVDALLGPAKRLVIVDLRDNKFDDLPMALVELPESLKRLDVQNNNLRALPPLLGRTPLTSLLLEGNMIRGLPRNTTTVALLRWLRDKIAVDAVEARVQQAQLSAHSSRSASPAPSPRSPRVAARSLHASSSNISSPTVSRRADPSPAATPIRRAGSRHIDPIEPIPQPEPARPATPEDVHPAVADSTAKTRVLDLSRKQLGVLPVLLDMPVLVELTLSHNALTSLPDTVALPASLEMLDLSHNQLTTLPAAWTLSESGTRLHTLNIAFNRLHEFRMDLTPLAHLAVLILCNNQIRTVHLPAASVPNLTHLDLSNNAMPRLDPVLARPANLKVFKVDGNTFRVPRYDVLRLGSDAVLQWCRSRLQ
ncbi:Leucine-rich repeat-containing protein 40 [Allomyces arbusculus]|nr:Leucine-rich repeat-containing protein 40 [Allomyces arbusculus]